MSESLVGDPKADITRAGLGDEHEEEHERPGDIESPELWSVLQTPGGRFRAGKSYRPDLSASRVAVKAEDYKLGPVFFCTLVVIHHLDDVFDLLRKLSSDPSAFVIRGMLADWSLAKGRHRVGSGHGSYVYRRSVKVHGSDGYFVDFPRQLQMLDLDGVPLQNEMSVVADPERCVQWAVDHLLPSEFSETIFVYQLSSSAGLTKLENELNVHLWFFTTQGYSNEELRAWARWWNAKRQCKIIDPALFTAVQPHYTNEPELLDGLIDPLAGRRLGLITRAQRAVKLYMPNAEELSSELKSRQSRAVKQYSRAQKPEALRPLKNSGQGEKSDTDFQIEPSTEIEGDAIPGGPYFDAVRLGAGWRGYLKAIGFEGHIRTQIRAAIGSYFHEHGARADRELVTMEIKKAIEETPFLGCDEAWSRAREDARGYLIAPPGGSSNVDEMIADIAALQAEKERVATEPCEPAWQLPTLAANEAFIQIQSAIKWVVLDALQHKRRRLNPSDPGILFKSPHRTAINCSPGTGKTEAMITGIVEFLCAEPTARVAIAVPTHKLGQGLAERVDKAFGSQIAAEWHGTERPDPLAPREKMCRLAEAARELLSLGGKLQLLCSRRGEKMEYCLHHPAVAGDDCCGYQRQQAVQARNRTRVWIVPATMLSTAPPQGLKRVVQLGEGDFDLLVIDEAPWFNLLPEAPAKLPIEALSPEWWRAQPSRATESQKRSAIDTLEKIYTLIAGLPSGEIPADVLASANIELSDVSTARRSIWKFKADLRGLVKPGWDRKRLKRALSAVASRNQRVIAVVEALHVMMRHLRGELAPSGVVVLDENNRRYLCLRRRLNINDAWLEAPTLYLDAADIGSFDIARAWLPDLELKVEARVTAPYMRIAQLADSQMAYQKLVAGEGGEQVTARNNRERLARLITSRGADGLIICPKKLRVAWEKAYSLPPGWAVWNFGAVRGRDEAGAVPRLVIVSRPLPSPGDAELIAETIFGQRVQRLPPGEWYPKTPVGRLMADGTGRRTLALRHPDPLVEAVRFAICEGELLQALGRGRGVRRTPETALDVLVLTNVPLPIPIDEMIPIRELSDTAGPLELLAVVGVVPLDHAGISTALCNWFADAEKVRNWFQYRPEARSRLRQIRQLAKEKGVVDACEFSGIPNIESPIGDSTKLAAYRYQRGGSRQANLVLVRGAVHTGARAAVEAVLGHLDDFKPVEKPRRRSRRRPSSSDEAIEALLDEIIAQGRDRADAAD